MRALHPAKHAVIAARRVGAVFDYVAVVSKRAGSARALAWDGDRVLVR